jgi:vacuole morphology and inheritance protein 14
MLLPQSSAFAALKNRLNSVSSIGYLHIAPRTYVPTPPVSRQGSVADGTNFLQFQAPTHSKFRSEAHSIPFSNVTTPAPSNYDRPNRLKGREDGIIRWGELLEKFRSVQDRARRAQGHARDIDDGTNFGVGDMRIGDGLEMKVPAMARTMPAPPVPLKDATPAATVPAAKPRSGLGRQFGRLGGAVSGRGKRNQ